jgi:pimeloyl-ACP methyl ester carboxylesterase
MPKIAAGDLEIAYEEHGQGEPVVLVMGWTGNRHHWAGFAQRLASKFRVLAFDNRGAGETTRTPGPYTIPQLADDTAAFVRALGLSRTNVLGVSMGGMIAQELALRHPSLVDRLVLGCTHFGGAGAIPPPPETVAALGFEGKSREQVTRDMLAVNVTPSFRTDRAAEFEDLVRLSIANRMRAESFFAQLAAITEHDTAARLGGITAPSLVVAGEDDALIPAENSRLLAPRIPGARLELLPRAGHMFWIEAQDRAAKVVGDFLSS